MCTSYFRLIYAHANLPKADAPIVRVFYSEKNKFDYLIIRKKLFDQRKYFYFEIIHEVGKWTVFINAAPREFKVT